MPKNTKNASTPKEIVKPVFATREERLYAATAYIPFLFVVSLAFKRQSSFVLFHVKQGIVLFGIELCLLLSSGIPFFGWLVSFVGWLAMLVFALIGFLRVAQSEVVPLPYIGKYAERFTLG